jgi:NAD(P)-dependent dehydrogenase (short-subunit alcohol dehydrogenase family)
VGLFEDKVVVVTGAGQGIGRNHALRFAAEGARVVVNDIGGGLHGEPEGNGNIADAVAHEIEEHGGIAVADTNTVATAEGGAAIVQTALDAFGQIDIVVNNAGILQDKTFHNMTADMDRAVIDVHLLGAFNVTRPAWVHFREQGYGRVVNTSSNSGLLGNFGQANYGAAKMGLVGFTHVLAHEGAKYNIKVNALAPVAATRMTEGLLGAMAEKVQPGLVSPIVGWLCHDDCPVTGEIYSAAGGRIARYFVGLTPGYYNPALTMEDVRDNFATIRDEEGYITPANPGEEFAALTKHF